MHVLTLSEMGRKSGTPKAFKAGSSSQGHRKVVPTISFSDNQSQDVSVSWHRSNPRDTSCLRVDFLSPVSCEPCRSTLKCLIRMLGLLSSDLEMSMSSNEGYLNDEDDGSGDSVVGGESASGLKPSYASGPRKGKATARAQETDEETMSNGRGLDWAYATAQDGPPLLLSQDGYRCENGYTVILWDDGYYYLYDDHGRLVEGECFINESDAEVRADEMKPTGFRR